MTPEQPLAIVTGSSKGIGKSYVKCLLTQGYKVIMFDVDTENGLDTEKELRSKYGETEVHFQKCDVTDSKQFSDCFQDVVQKHGHVSVMVNNAGTVDEFTFENCVAVNFVAMIRGTNLAIDHMRKDKGGKGGMIINTASVLAFIPGHHLAAYCGTKSGILHFTRSWAVNPRCDELGLTFMCLCPGYVDTNLTQTCGSKTLDEEYFEKTKTMYASIPLEVIESAIMTLLTDKRNGAIIDCLSTTPKYVEVPDILKQ